MLTLKFHFSNRAVQPRNQYAITFFLTTYVHGKEGMGDFEIVCGRCGVPCPIALGRYISHPPSSNDNGLHDRYAGDGFQTVNVYYQSLQVQVKAIL